MKTAWLGLAALALCGGSAQAAVSVIGGGMAEACAKAAIAGETEIKFEKVCSDALDSEVLSPRDRAGTFINRGVLKLRRGRFQPAEADFNAAVKLKPDMGEAYVNRGAAVLGQKRFADSVPDFNKSLELGLEEPAKAYYNRALAYEGLDDMKAAYFDYQKAVELQPEWEAPKEQLTRFSVTRKEH